MDEGDWAGERSKRPGGSAQREARGRRREKVESQFDAALAGPRSALRRQSNREMPVTLVTSVKTAMQSHAPRRPVAVCRAASGRTATSPVGLSVLYAGERQGEGLTGI